ncbi:MAG TPA: glycogen debranching N-terminal domain-containing protein, partial [Actinomycetota bacterium]|nr:glycogen debranching N-terminal domain-containing protein [Actinomycetota bacterium]
MELRRTDVPSPQPPAEPHAPPEGIPPLAADFASKVLAIKEGETFLYSDIAGNLDDRREYGHGFYHRDTRFLSHFRMKVSGRDPVLLSSSSERAYMSYVDLTNPELFVDGDQAVPQQTLNIRRVRAIHGRLFERIRVKNYNPYPVQTSMSFSMAADFADIFEVRGFRADDRGHSEPPLVRGSRAEFSHRGIDDVARKTVIEFDPHPDRLDVAGDQVVAEFTLELAPHQTRLISMTMDPVIGEVKPLGIEFDSAVHHLRRSYEDWERECTQITTDNEVFNSLVVRGLRDLRALYTSTDQGGIIAAGIPWYVAVFGRDALISSHQLLTVNPKPARDA